MRAVLDTNVVISATLIRDGSEDRILRAWQRGTQQVPGGRHRGPSPICGHRGQGSPGLEDIPASTDRPSSCVLEDRSEGRKDEIVDILPLFCSPNLYFKTGPFIPAGNEGSPGDPTRCPYFRGYVSQTPRLLPSTLPA